MSRLLGWAGGIPGSLRPVLGQAWGFVRRLGNGNRCWQVWRGPNGDLPLAYPLRRTWVEEPHRGAGTGGTAPRGRDRGHRAGLLSVFVQGGWIQEGRGWVLALREVSDLSHQLTTLSPGGRHPARPSSGPEGHFQHSDGRSGGTGGGRATGSFRLLPRSRERAPETSNVIFSLSGTF